MSKDNVGWQTAAKRADWLPDRVKLHLQKTQVDSKNHYDRKHSCKTVQVAAGDIVRVKYSGLLVKGQNRYSQPLKVEKVFCNSALLSGRCQSEWDSLRTETPEGGDKCG